MNIAFIVIVIAYALYILDVINFDPAPAYQITVSAEELNISTESQLSDALEGLTVDREGLAELLKPTGITVEEFEQSVNIQFITNVQTETFLGLTLKFHSENKDPSRKAAYDFVAKGIIEHLTQPPLEESDDTSEVDELINTPQSP